MPKSAKREWKEGTTIVAMDRGYEGALRVDISALFRIVIAIVQRRPDQTGFVVPPSRWIVECIFAW